MYTVFSGGTIAYLGDNRTDALEILDSKEEATLNQVSTLAILSGAFATYRETFATDEDDPQPEFETDDPLDVASDAMEQILQKLDDAGFNAGNIEEIYGQLGEKAVNAVAEVKSVGIKSMAVVGKGFIALGDLMMAFHDEGSTEVESSNEPVID